MIRASVTASAVALVALALAIGAFGRTSTTVLHGTVGPGFTIHVTKDGASVKSLRPGTYKLVVSDRASIHNFVLEKEHGWEKQVTSVGFTGTKTVTVKLTKGSYKFYCEPHQSVMFGTFTVK